MNAAFRTTALMGLIAAAMAYGAFVYYPWPREEVVDAKVSQNLFDEYETSSVREIRITKFNSEKSNVGQLQLRRKGEQWILPRYNDYVASNVARIAETAKSLIDREVFEKTSDSQEDHVEFGVVDPGEAGPTSNRASLGTKIVLKDRNRKDLAALIIGKKVKNDPTGIRHYVRVPGQPTVYAIDVNKNIFETEFAAWIDPNLMEIPLIQGGEVAVSGIEIDNYRLDADPEKVASSKRQPFYNANFDLAAKPPKLNLRGVDESGKLVLVDADQEKTREFSKGLSILNLLQYRGVFRKPKAMAAILAKPTEGLDASAFKDLNQLGVVYRKFVPGKGPEFDAAGGEILLTTSDGVTVNMLIGSIANKTATELAGLSYNVMMIASVNESVLEIPKKPDGVSEDSAEYKGYHREVAERERKIQSATLRATEMNKAYSQWVYIMPDEVISTLRPEVEVLVEKKVELKQETEEDTDGGDTSEKENASEKEDADN